MSRPFRPRITTSSKRQVRDRFFLVMSSQILMARQPICDRTGRVTAYELLYRSTTPRGSEPLSDQESAEALMRSLIDIGLDTLVPDHLAFVNIPASLLGNPALHLLPHERVVIEILEDTLFNSETEAQMRELRSAGYKLAFDDCTFAEEHVKFFPYVEIVKVDILETPAKFLRDQVEDLQDMGIQVLAEKVETHEVHRKCLDLGCDLFQGYFFAKPEIVKGSRMPNNRQVTLILLSKLQQHDVSLDEIEQMISCDVALSFRLLRLLNSAAVGLPQTVKSIRQAVLLLGLEKLTAVAGLLLMTSIGGQNNELINTAMIRARMCERLAMIKRAPDAHSYFTVGLFSVLDALSGQPMSEVVASLPLSPEVCEALLNINGDTLMANALSVALAYEHGEFNRALEWLAEEESIQLSIAYAEAVEWASSMNQYLAA